MLTSVEIAECSSSIEANIIERIDWLKEHLDLFSPQLWQSGSIRASFPDGPLNEAAYVLGGLHAELSDWPAFKELLFSLTELRRNAPSCLSTQPYSTLARIYLSNDFSEKRVLRQRLISLKLPSPTLDKLFFIQELDAEKAIVGYGKVVNQLIGRSVESDTSGYIATHVALYSTRFFSANANLSPGVSELLLKFVFRCLNAQEDCGSLDLLLELLATYLHLSNAVGNPTVDNDRVYKMALFKLAEERSRRLQQSLSNDLDPNIYHQCLAAVLLSIELHRMAVGGQIKEAK